MEQGRGGGKVLGSGEEAAGGKRQAGQRRKTNKPKVVYHSPLTDSARGGLVHDRFLSSSKSKGNICPYGLSVCAARHQDAKTMLVFRQN